MREEKQVALFAESTEASSAINDETEIAAPPAGALAYAEIAVLAPLPSLTYAIPLQLLDKVQVGSRVIVPLSARKMTGYVLQRYERSPIETAQLRNIEAVVDTKPLLDKPFLDTLRWMADYYFAPLGEVVKSALPAQLHQTSKPGVSLSEEGFAWLRDFRVKFAANQVQISAKALLLSSIEREGTVALTASLDSQLLQELLEEGLLQKSALLSAAKDKAPQEKYVERTENTPRKTLTAKQRLVYEALAEGPRLLRELASEIPGSRASIKSLSELGLLIIKEREVERDPFLIAPRYTQKPALNEAQQRAVDACCSKLQCGEYASYLLHGVTGSGKTEVYLHAIEESERLGRGSIVLVPEISLTPQLAGIFRGRFGEKVAILHSALTDSERFEQWRKIQEGKRSIVVGVRSAIFAPIQNLGMVVVDEEHDSSFKQEDRLRYNARDVALVRAKYANAVALVGSATPSLESHASTKIQRLHLPERATSQQLPNIELIDLKQWKGQLESDMLSPPLIHALASELEQKGQSILFLNRRGFASFVLCQSCGYTFECRDCDVTLTHHKINNRLTCHYCNYSLLLPHQCPKCAESSLALLGVGTERIEARLQELFPKARVMRLDRDTATPKDMEAMLSRFARGDADILVGTQMISKGHDFSGVSLVGVVLADMALRLPDFRAAERSFQLLVQVAGRAGRGSRPGRVLLQSFVPEHDSIQCAKDHDYFRFAALELERRKALSFPPYAHLAALRLDGPEGPAIVRAAELLRRRAVALAPRGVEILGPAPAPLSRLKNKLRFQFLAKSSSRPVLRGFLKELLQARPLIQAPVTLSIDIDPVSML